MIKSIYTDKMEKARKKAIEIYFAAGYNAMTTYLQICVKTKILTEAQRCIVSHDAMDVVIKK